MSETATIELPAAPPGQYMAWMAFWREVERRMLDRPALERFSSTHSAPFLHDYVAEFISSVLVRQIMDQAAVAERNGDPLVAPVLRADPDLLAESLDYVRRRGEWLAAPEVAEAMRIEPLEPELSRLRADVVEAVGNVLTNLATRRSLEERANDSRS